MNVLAQPLQDRPRPGTAAKWLFVAFTAALMPALIALILLGSVAWGRPLVGRRGTPALARAVTIAWGVGLIVIGLVQGASAMLLGMSVTNPTDLIIRTLVSAALEGLLFVGIRAYLSRRSLPSAA
jgi:hypothetical protein